MIVWGVPAILPAANTILKRTQTDSWSSISLIDAPEAARSVAVWTGNRLVVWGGSGPTYEPMNSGGIYDPVADTWVPIPADCSVRSLDGPLAVWTGEQMIVWSYGGASYDPELGQWFSMSSDQAPSPRNGHTMVWVPDATPTGSGRLLVWGGAELGDGRVYDFLPDIWLNLSPAGAPSGRSGHSAVWTGTEMIVWGGYSSDGALGDGARYSP